jgi:hypothetical protein
MPLEALRLVRIIHRVAMQQQAAELARWVVSPGARIRGNRAQWLKDSWLSVLTPLYGYRAEDFI